MHDRISAGEARISARLADRLRPALHPQRLPMDVSAWHLNGEPVPAAAALRADCVPFAVGGPWGRHWATPLERARSAGDPDGSLRVLVRSPAGFLCDVGHETAEALCSTCRSVPAPRRPLARRSSASTTQEP